MKSPRFSDLRRQRLQARAGSAVRAGLAGVWLTLAAGCAFAPVQEMSDARQAIQSAREAGADQYSADRLLSAEKWLKRAEEGLHTGEFSTARESAVAARNEAVIARESALQKSGRTAP